MKMRLALCLALVLCGLALFAVSSVEANVDDEPMWFEEDFFMEGLIATRELVEDGVLPEGGVGKLKRLNPNKRFAYAHPTTANCPGIEQHEVNTCFTYFKDDDQKWYMQNCCACDVDTKFNINNPANGPNDQPPRWIFFNQGPISAGQKWRLFFMDDNPTLEPALYSAELIDC